MAPEAEARLRDLVQADRQWIRTQRIQHARAMIKKSVNDPVEKEIWERILKMNSY